MQKNILTFNQRIANFSRRNYRPDNRGIFDFIGCELFLNEASVDIKLLTKEKVNNYSQVVSNRDSLTARCISFAADC